LPYKHITRKPINDHSNSSVTFNELVEYKRINFMSAIPLLDEPQIKWGAQAKRDRTQPESRSTRSALLFDPVFN